MFSCKHWEIFKNIYFEKHLQTIASENSDSKVTQQWNHSFIFFFLFLNNLDFILFVETLFDLRALTVYGLTLINNDFDGYDTT